MPNINLWYTSHVNPFKLGFDFYLVFSMKTIGFQTSWYRNSYRITTVVLLGFRRFVGCDTHWTEGGESKPFSRRSARRIMILSLESVVALLYQIIWPFLVRVSPVLKLANSTTLNLAPWRMNFHFLLVGSVPKKTIPKSLWRIYM